MRKRDTPESPVMAPAPAPEENPGAFKHWINAALLRKMARAIGARHPGFEGDRLIALADELGPLELKARVRLVRDRLRELLPEEFPEAARILVASAREGYRERPGGDAVRLESFDLWPYTEYIQTHGLAHFEESMSALHFLTQLFTAEFAVRPFLNHDFAAALARLTEWSRDPNPHVRRLASEGTRLRLPWGENVRGLSDAVSGESTRGGSANAIAALPTLPILESLKFDDELYVRKSVANHLNDLSRPLPETVVALLARWQREASTNDRAKIDWITRRALRTLIKAGHPGALKLIGVSTGAKVQASKLRLNAARFRVGDTLEFSFEIASQAKGPQKLVVDYLIHHMTARGETSPKAFKLKTFELPAGETMTLRKRHSLREITTRSYYPGAHALEIQVNGKVLLKREWNLLPGTGGGTA